MGRQISYISYSGLDKDKRIDCLAAIRKAENPPGSTVLDTENLCKINRSTHEDAISCDKQLEPRKFADIGEIEF